MIRRFKDRSINCKLTGSSTDSKRHRSFTNITIIQNLVDSPTGQTPSLVHIFGTASSKEQEPRITRTHFGRLCVCTSWIMKDKMWRLAVALSVWDIPRWNSDNKRIVLNKVVHVPSNVPPDRCHSAPEQRLFK